MSILHFFQTTGMGWFLLLSAKVSLLLAVALAVHRLLKNQSASNRHFLMTAALLLILLLPLVSVALPTIGLFDYPVADGHAAATPILLRGESGDRVSPDIKPAISSQQVPVVSEISHTMSLPLSILVATYVLGTVLCLLRLLSANLWMWWLRRNAAPLYRGDNSLVAIADEVARGLGVSKNYRIKFSRRLTVPVVVGSFRPAILLPASAANWSAAQARSVFLHEFAHIRRLDTLTSMAVHLVGVWQWFNPLVWMALRQCDIEREKACDDRALLGGVDNLDYADHLVMIGKSAARARWQIAAGSAMASPRSIARRIHSILDPTINRKSATIAGRFVHAVLIAAVVLPAATVGGKSQQLPSRPVTAAQQNQVRETLRGFFDALSDGLAFDSVRHAYLSSHYFDQPNLTMENRDRGEWDAIRKRMTATSYDRKVLFHPVVTGTIEAVNQNRDTFEVSLLLNVFNDAAPDSGTYFVKDLHCTVAIVREQGALRISRFDGGLSFMRMDISSPYGPIFLVWMEDMGSGITLFGPFIIKIIPESIRQENSYALYMELEE